MTATNYRLSFIGAAAILLACAGLASAQPKPAAAPEIPVKPTKVRSPESTVGTSELLQRLSSDDATIRHGAIELIKDRFATQPGRVLDLRTQIFKTLMAARHFDEAVDIAWAGIASNSHDTKTVESFQQARVKALLAAGKTEEALQSAKSLFNVSTMTGTSDAILLIAESLNAARPKDKESFNKFREEQMAGAATQPANTPVSISAGKGPRSTVLDSIKVDPKAYEELLAKLTGEDYQSLMARGNLLLMADNPKAAREIFERMYSLSGSSELVEASEALARSIRAEDGTIGRANSWVLAIKPKPQAIPTPPVAPVAPAPAKKE